MGISKFLLKGNRELFIPINYEKQNEIEHASQAFSISKQTTNQTLFTIAFKTDEGNKLSHRHRISLYPRHIWNRRMIAEQQTLT